MSEPIGDAAVRAVTQVTVGRDDPAARLGLAMSTYYGPIGRAPRHLPFRRAAMSFMRWEADRGVLDPVDADRPGSAWWRAINERLLRDGCEAVARSGGLLDEMSSPLSFPTAIRSQVTSRSTSETGTVSDGCSITR